VVCLKMVVSIGLRVKLISMIKNRSILRILV
jgi:hypothetical protein